MKTIQPFHGPALTRHLSAAALSLLLAAGAANAAVTVTPTVVNNGGVYTYTYSISNTGPATLAFVEIPIGQGVVVLNESAPTGFVIFADGPPVNAVTLAEDNDFFTPQEFVAGSTVGGFSYDSVSLPGTVTFTAMDINGDTFTGQTLSAVPEPSGLLLVAASALPLLAARRRRNG